MTLVDTNVLIDVLTGDPDWMAWSIGALSARRAVGDLAIVDAVYAELSGGFASRAELDRVLAEMGVVLRPMTRDALFLAGQAFRRYRQQGGTKTNVLADFFIGAQAMADAMPVLTRDAGRYRSNFPDVDLIVPEQ